MIITTVSSETEAKKISKFLLDERLVACVNIIPNITSIYRWNDEIQEEKELLMLFKTKIELEEKVIAKIKQLHSYDVPAIYAIKSTEKIFESYYQWIKDETIEVI